MINIMIIENDKELLKSIKKHTESNISDYKVVLEVENGKQALEQIANYDVHLILLNIKLPQMSGYHVFEKMSEKYPDIKFIIYNVGYDEFDIIEVALSKGLLDYITKPIKLGDITRILNNAKKVFKSVFEKKEQKKLSLLKYFKMLPQFQDRFLINLVHGHVDTHEEVLRWFQYFSLSLTEPYCTMIIKIDYFDKLSLVFDEQDKQMFVFEVYEKVREIISEINVVSFINRFDEITLIISNMEDKYRAIEIATKICETVQRETVTTVTIGIGRPQKLANNINISYKEAKGAIRHRYHMGKGIAIHIDHAEPQNTVTYSYPDKKEQLLIYETVIGNKAKVMKLLDDIFDSISKNKKLPDKFIPKTILNILVSINRYASEQNIDIESLYAKYFSVKEIMKKETVKEGYEYLIEILGIICIYMNDYREKNETILIEKVEDYLKNNYSREITVNDIAIKYNVSAEYINRIFKKHIDKSFYNYSIKIRMDKAKELIEQTDMDDWQIAHEVGYEDHEYFLSLFNYTQGINTYDLRIKRKNFLNKF